MLRKEVSPNLFNKNDTFKLKVSLCGAYFEFYTYLKDKNYQ